MSQCHDLLEHFKQGGTLTVAEALSRFGVYALSQRCGELRKEGHDIRDEWVKSNGKKFKRYYLAREQG